MEDKTEELIKNTVQELNSIGFAQPINVPKDKLYEYNYFFEQEKDNAYPFANQLLINNGAGIGINLELDWEGEGKYFDEAMYELLHKIRIYSKNYKPSNIHINWEYVSIRSTTLICWFF